MVMPSQLGLLNEPYLYGRRPKPDGNKEEALAQGLAGTPVGAVMTEDDICGAVSCV